MDFVIVLLKKGVWFSMKKLISVILLAALFMTLTAALAAPLSGGWTPSSNPKVTKDVKALLKKATKTLVGVEYTPVAYLGSQVVAGKNHAVLCQAAAAVPDAQPYYAIVYLYESLDGKAEILSIADLDIGALCEY